MLQTSSILLLCLPSLLLEQSPAAKSVREVALNLAVTMTANEIANVTEREALELMNQLVTTIVTGVSFHQSEMDRVLR